MARLRYTTFLSLDGFTEDAAGGIGWSEPDEEVLAFVNGIEGDIGTYLYGRGMYESMRFWETALEDPDVTGGSRAFAALWLAAEKVVYSSTLEATDTARTSLERRFEPGEVQERKDRSAVDLSVGGPGLAGAALRSGLVDDVHLLVVPVVLGGGKPAFPEGVGCELQLADHRRFAGGVVHLHYRVVLGT
jgi:dihydrofolate reductase